MRTANKNVLRLNESQIRRIIRSLIREAPLVDLPDGNPAYLRGTNLTDRQTYQYGDLIDAKRSSIGFKRALEFKDSAAEIFKNTTHRWAVVMPPFAFLNTSDSETKELGETGLLDWARHLGIPPGTKIIVVGSSVFNSEDFDDINWTLRHDTLGHALMRACTQETAAEQRHILLSAADKIIEVSSPGSQVSSVSRRIGARLPNIIFEIAHDCLPDDAKVSKTQGVDVAPDVFAAIFLEDIEEDSFVQLAKSEISSAKFDRFTAEFASTKDINKTTSIRALIGEAFEQIMRLYFEYVRNWAENFPVDKPTLVIPW